MNELFATVVHDVKNLLAELALRLAKHEDLKTEVHLALDSARRLTDLLLIIKQDANLVAVNINAINPEDFLAALAAEYRELFPGLRIALDVSRAPLYGFFDDSLVRLAFGGAIHNACRHARSQVGLAAYSQDKQLVLEVCNDGERYPAEILANGGNAPAAASTRGTGLGLYLANRIAKLHQQNGRQGCIQLVNQTGEAAAIPEGGATLNQSVTGMAGHDNQAIATFRMVLP